MLALKIYIEAHCAGCDEARRLASEISPLVSGLNVELIHLNGPGVERPPAVFGTPAYVLDGRVLCLGNPSKEDLRAILEAAIG